MSFFKKLWSRGKKPAPPVYRRATYTPPPAQRPLPQIEHAPRFTNADRLLLNELVDQVSGFRVRNVRTPDGRIVSNIGHIEENRWGVENAQRIRELISRNLNLQENLVQIGHENAVGISDLIAEFSPQRRGMIADVFNIPDLNDRVEEIRNIRDREISDVFRDRGHEIRAHFAQRGLHGSEAEENALNNLAHQHAQTRANSRVQSHDDAMRIYNEHVAALNARNTAASNAMREMQTDRMTSLQANTAMLPQTNQNIAVSQGLRAYDDDQTNRLSQNAFARDVHEDQFALGMSQNEQHRINASNQANLAAWQGEENANINRSHERNNFELYDTQMYNQNEANRHATDMEAYNSRVPFGRALVGSVAGSAVGGFGLGLGSAAGGMGQSLGRNIFGGSGYVQGLRYPFVNRNIF